MLYLRHTKIVKKHVTILLNEAISIYPLFVFFTLNFKVLQLRMQNYSAEISVVFWNASHEIWIFCLF